MSKKGKKRNKNNIAKKNVQQVQEAVEQPVAEQNTEKQGGAVESTAPEVHSEIVAPETVENAETQAPEPTSVVENTENADEAPPSETVQEQEETPTADTNIEDATPKGEDVPTPSSTETVKPRERELPPDDPVAILSSPTGGIPPESLAMASRPKFYHLVYFLSVLGFMGALAVLCNGFYNYNENEIYKGIFCACGAVFVYLVNIAVKRKHIKKKLAAIKAMEEQPITENIVNATNPVTEDEPAVEDAANASGEVAGESTTNAVELTPEDESLMSVLQQDESTYTKSESVVTENAAGVPDGPTPIIMEAADIGSSPDTVEQTEQDKITEMQEGEDVTATSSTEAISENEDTVADTEDAQTAESVEVSSEEKASDNETTKKVLPPPTDNGMVKFEDAGIATAQEGFEAVATKQEKEHKKKRKKLSLFGKKKQKDAETPETVAEAKAESTAEAQETPQSETENKSDVPSSPSGAGLTEAEAVKKELRKEGVAFDDKDIPAFFAPVAKGPFVLTLILVLSALLLKEPIHDFLMKPTANTTSNIAVQTIEDIAATPIMNTPTVALQVDDTGNLSIDKQELEYAPDGLIAGYAKDIGGIGGGYVFGDSNEESAFHVADALPKTQAGDVPQTYRAINKGDVLLEGEEYVVSYDGYSTYDGKGALALNVVNKSNGSMYVWAHGSAYIDGIAVEVQSKCAVESGQTGTVWLVPQSKIFGFAQPDKVHTIKIALDVVVKTDDTYTTIAENQMQKLLLSEGMSDLVLPRTKYFENDKVKVSILGMVSDTDYQGVYLLFENKTDKELNLFVNTEINGVPGFKCSSLALDPYSYGIAELLFWNDLVNDWLMPGMLTPEEKQNVELETIGVSVELSTDNWNTRLDDIECPTIQMPRRGEEVAS